MKNLIRALSYSERLHNQMSQLTERYGVGYLSFLVISKSGQAAYISSDSFHILKLFNENKYNGLAQHFLNLIQYRNSSILDFIAVDKSKDDCYMRYFHDNNFRNIFTHRLDVICEKFDRIYSVIAFKDDANVNGNKIIMNSKNIFCEVTEIKNLLFLERNNIECLPFVSFKEEDEGKLNDTPSNEQPFEIVSKFEKEIISFLMGGMTHSQIANILSISTTKVYSTLYKLTKEYNFSSPYAMVVYLMRHKLI